MEPPKTKVVWFDPEFAKKMGITLRPDGTPEPLPPSGITVDSPLDIQISALGPLHRYEAIPEWIASVPVAVPFFDGMKLPFMLVRLQESDQKEIEEAVGEFLKLGPEARVAASGYVVADYNLMQELVSEVDLGCSVESTDEIWRHVQPMAVHISRRHRRDCAIYVQVLAECDWEPEHGLQIVFRRGAELSRVSSQDGHITTSDAWDLPEEQDRIVS
ncbi:hypothetical protein Acid345_2429 [Candidatus Koribacter versatilis Ellin345]|uniref:DUF6985 domain-containing protein n=1 Tax=Koribacter versatilis (strain Ellin345) TaxID=204669 RepID=Q1INX0_KORVE|nr:hypothetical protein [Candidatus Koribacter versatilis]ABF41430.1 hypothetical protein Acid345_2429 [Candidatus Koribacter versatilis Ellin345]